MSNNIHLFVKKDERYDEDEIVPGEEDWNDWPEDLEFEDDPNDTVSPRK